MPSSVPQFASCLALCLLAAPAFVAQRPAASDAQTAAPKPATIDLSAPLPDVNTLMRQVEIREGAFEKIRQDYLFHIHAINVDTDGNGKPKKSETLDEEEFTVEGVQIVRKLAKNGVPLNDSEKKKEDERIDKEIAKAKEQRAKGESGNGREYTITAERFLELGTFSNPRRELRNGRSTIVIDYAGDPKAKTHNPLEGIVHDLSGTVWVDELDHTLARAEGHFSHSFKIGGGLVASIKEGTHFEAEWAKINGEVWLPSHVHGEGSARLMLLFSTNGSLDLAFSGYRKFKTTSTILPNAQTDAPATPDGTQSAEPAASPAPQKSNAIDVERGTA